MKLGPFFISTVVSALLAAGSAFAADPMAPQTRENLIAAMHGEAFANLKYLRYAQVARHAGNEKLAKLFEDSANVEATDHFAREADALKLDGSSGANLLDAMAGEHYENKTMYVKFADEAQKAGDLKTAALFREIAGDEGDHYAQYKAAYDKLRVK